MSGAGSRHGPVAVLASIAWSFSAIPIMEGGVARVDSEPSGQ